MADFLDDFAGSSPKKQADEMPGLLVGPAIDAETFAKLYEGPQNWKLRSLVVFDEEGKLGNPEDFPASITTVAEADAFVAAVQRYIK